jgi:hypothetical protein
MDPLAITREAEQLIFEDPDDYIKRSLQTNPGVNMLNLPSMFVDIVTGPPEKVGVTNPLTDIIKMISGERI